MDTLSSTKQEEYTMEKSNLQIQCNAYQAANGIFQRTRTNNFTICMEIQKKSQIAKAVLRKKNGTGGINLELTSISATKPQSSRQYGTGTKTEI